MKLIGVFAFILIYSVASHANNCSAVPAEVSKLADFCAFDYSSQEKSQLKEYFKSKHVVLIPGFLNELFGQNSPGASKTLYFRQLEDEIQSLQTLQHFDWLPGWIKDDIAGGVSYLYPSSTVSIEQNTAEIARQLKSLSDSLPDKTIIVVGHSMGGGISYYLPWELNQNGAWPNWQERISSFVSVQGSVGGTPLAQLALMFAANQKPEMWDQLEALATEDAYLNVGLNFMPRALKKAVNIFGQDPFVSMDYTSASARQFEVASLPTNIRRRILFVTSEASSENDEVPMVIYPSLVFMDKILQVPSDGFVPLSSQKDMCPLNKTMHIENADHSSLNSPKGVTNSAASCRNGFARAFLLFIMNMEKERERD